MKPFDLLRQNPLLRSTWLFILFSFFSCHTAGEAQLRPLPDKTLAEASLPKAGLNFLVLGDWGRKGKHHQREVAEQMGLAARQMNSSFIVTTGDNFYTKIKNVYDPAWKESFENVYTAESLEVPWYVTLGNHDYKGSVQAQIDYSKISSRWQLPDRYYTIERELDDTTCVQFLFLDTTPLMKFSGKKQKRLNKNDQQAAAQLRWLENTLSTSHCQWKIAVGHHPVYATGSKHGRIRRMATHLKPLFEKYGVQAYFAGHEHDLQYLRGKGQVNYFISGAGSKTHKVHHSERAVFSAGVSGFIAVSLTPERMSIVYVDYSGQVLYRTGVERCGSH